ncbi:cytochrome P450 monooxygenase-like protein [Lophiostoma macrostomum CBS 122681]|uniref:Cytochrome P450 monooxygenase ABA1 n=1 Tax=Lophiostoma macrostomum CBS 122681 TaxID=1314788 RepID=A0A6A6TPW6_9PLEO|nr:cytochrome P450 monooxygenase-like protein [Lophiostoma macrostomum CBS 122681]
MALKFWGSAASDYNSWALPLRSVYLIGLFLCLYAAVGRLRQYWRLRHFKGPPSTGISWLWHSRAVISGDSHSWYGYATEKYGPIARIAPNHLITSSPERAEWYYHAARFEPGKDNIFTECDNERHDARRKKMAAGYSGRENPGLEASIDIHVKDLVHLIRSKYASPPNSKKVTKPMDLATKIQYLTLDVISEVGLGKAFGDLKSDQDVNDYLAAMEVGLRIGNQAFGMGTSWLRDVLFLGKRISPSEKDEKGFGRMMSEARKVITARLLKSTEERSDMLSSFIRHGLTGDDLFQETFETMLAGSDTTSASIRIILLYLMTHPRVYAKLQAEIDGAIKAGNAPKSPGVISDSEARKLPYLSAVIREGMRVYPPVSNLFSRVVPQGGDVVKVDGEEHFLPGGTMIGYSAWGMHRHDKATYGEDAEVFRPERWFVDESDPLEKERLARMYKINDMIFGYGRWICIGRVVALIELHKTIFELLRNFDLALTNPDRPWTIFNTMGLFAIGDMWVDVSERH